MAHVTIEEAIKDIAAGKMVILVDDEERANEGDLTIAAEKVTPEAINFMAHYGRGLICMPLTGEKIDSLELPQMVGNNRSRFQTGFTVSIEARYGVTTGISAADRAATILTAVADHAKPDDLVRPGHVFPLRARRGGVMVRSGHTEGSVELARLAGLKPAGVICGIMDDDGTMAKMPSLEKFSKEHGINICTIADLIEYRMRTESFVHRTIETVIPTVYGPKFTIVVYESDFDDLQHIALIKGKINSNKPILVRVHSECLIGDVLGSLRCQCRDQLHKSIEMIDTEGTGVLLYMRQESTGMNLLSKVKAHIVKDQLLDIVKVDEKLELKPDLRNYGIGAQILVDLGIKKMRLITNNPKKIVGLQGYGLSVLEQVPIELESDEFNASYLEYKKMRLDPLLDNIPVPQ
ncbi:MAG: 3,4-dihydroxy-2-butanone-4-phosphate synthase [Desulfobacteraceae bacterium]|nr:MAG: 3,4-dihydroxy-2-butanone-4-phosphate synthase [Desulfobacteraceae bacterium]